MPVLVFCLFVGIYLHHSHLSSPIDKTTMLYLIPLKNQINT